MLSLRASIPVVCALLTGESLAQLRSGMPLGILEGRLAALTATSLDIDMADGRTQSCAFDGRTFIDQERRRLYAKDLKLGDLLELVTERQNFSVPCFARMIHVANTQRRFGLNPRPGNLRRATESFSPRGDILVTGVVRDLQTTFLEIRTRLHGPLRFRIRADTLFLRDGSEVLAADIERTLPVAIRAGYSLDGEMEVYQVTWGSIVQPVLSPQPVPPVARPPIEPLY